MIHHMDEGIGRVLGALDDGGIARDTIVVFTSDNGGERFSDNWPLVGGKMDLMEGGIRVPYVVRWPARTPAGTVTEQLAITMDWVPTFLEAAAPLRIPTIRATGFAGEAARRSARRHRAPALLAHEAQRAARDARRPLEVPEGQRARIPVRRGERRARARQSRQAPPRAPVRDARGLGDVGRNDAAHPAEAGVRLVYGKKDMP
jgi:arylsulfatase A-like enzyme